MSLKPLILCFPYLLTCATPSLWHGTGYFKVFLHYYSTRGEKFRALNVSSTHTFAQTPATAPSSRAPTSDSHVQLQLMNEFWREGLVLAEERKAEIRVAEAECEKVCPTT